MTSYAFIYQEGKKAQIEYCAGRGNYLGCALVVNKS